MNLQYKLMREVTITCGIEERERAFTWCKKNKYKITEESPISGTTCENMRIRIKAQKKINW